jgi:peptidyl-prolyl cis-trans isomerase C
MVNKVNASHILVKTETEALACLTYLKTKTFEELAKEKSLCPSGKRGGSLGWFSRGQMVPEFEKAAFNAKKDQVIGPIKTQFGYHLIKVLDTQ